MRKTRIIPILLIHNEGVYKTKKFNKPTYIGDPINTIRLFNDLEIDEISIIDIDSSISGKEPNISLIEELASEAFVPVTVGGGIKNKKHVENILNAGVEKVLINSSFIDSPDMIYEISKDIGRQSLVISIDVKKDLFSKYKVYSYIKKKNLDIDLIDLVLKAEEIGAGELFVNSVDNDGMMKGLDCNLIQLINKTVSIPLVICGGASSFDDLVYASKMDVSGIAVGSLFIYHGKERGILINYPSQEDLDKNIR